MQLMVTEENLQRHLGALEITRQANAEAEANTKCPAEEAVITKQLHEGLKQAAEMAQQQQLINNWSAGYLKDMNEERKQLHEDRVKLLNENAARDAAIAEKDKTISFIDHQARIQQE